MGNQNLKILVLGGSGFIGKNLSQVLTEKNYKVTTKSRTTGLDLMDINNVQDCLAEIKPDFIFNVAAHTGSLHYVTTYAADVIHDNIQMSLNLYKAAQQHCPKATIVNPLSNCSYPGNADIQIEDQWWDGPVHESVFSYGNAKRFLYVLAKCYFIEHSLKSINYLVPNTFGPGDSTDPNKTHALNGMIIRMIKAQANGDKKFEIWGTGSPIREWTYVDDVVTVLVKSLSLKKSLIEPVNIGQNKGYSIKESAEFIAKALGFKGKLVFNTKYQDGAPKKILDDANFKQIFSDFVFSDHKTGIAKTAKYYQSVLK